MKAFKSFNVAFPGLVGNDVELSDNDMGEFTDFVLQMMYPPNPNRALNGFLIKDPAGDGMIFDDVSWLDAAKASPTWDAVSWLDGWADVSWSDVSWSDVSWSDVSWADVSWSDVSWSDVSWTDVSWADLANAVYADVPPS